MSNKNIIVFDATGMQIIKIEVDWITHKICVYQYFPVGNFLKAIVT